MQGARVVFRQAIRRSERGGVVCEAVAEVACVGAADGRPRRLPKSLMDTFKAPVTASTSGNA